MLPVVAVVLFALSGCTFVAPGSSVGSDDSTTEATVKTVVIDQADVRNALGPVPPDPEFTPALVDDYVARSLDWQWANLLTSFPNAQRPDVVEIERVTGDNPRRTQCGDVARAAGLDPQSFAIAAFVCAAEYPSIPNGTLSQDQAGYLYDYWTGFVLPCYAAAGYPDKSAPPTREYFAANWPFQNWSPQPKSGGYVVGGPEYDTLIANCPGFPDGLN